MAADNHQLEALKLVADWCKTLITINTAAIAAIGVFVKSGQESVHSAPLFSAAIVAFIFSNVLTTWMMVSLPTSIQDIVPGATIWQRPVIFLAFSLPTWVVAYMQMLFFLLGVVTFAAGTNFRLLMFNS